MKTYLATDIEDDSEYSIEFEAESLEHAQRICEASGWLFDGELIASVPYDVNHPIPSVSIQ